VPSAIRSAFSASVALAATGAIAVSPLAPAPEVHIPTVQISGIELTAAPAFGAIPYQILVNLLGDALALAPIVIGSIEQCTVCIGPVSPPGPAASPFTGWGALGFGVGLLTTPFAIVGALGAGQSITQSLGAGILAFQIPADNSFALFAAPRAGFGGYEFAATRARARQAVTDAIVGTLGVGEQVLTGVRQIINSGLLGITYFAETLVAGGNVIAALQAGLAPITASIETALGNTVGAIQILREAVYTDLTSGPGPATFPIPTVVAASAASAASADTPRSLAAAKATASAVPAATGDNDSPGGEVPAADAVTGGEVPAAEAVTGGEVPAAEAVTGGEVPAAEAVTGGEVPAAEAVTGDSGRAVAKPSRARSEEARSVGARPTGARATR
jgi:hypothetical protein